MALAVAWIALAAPAARAEGLMIMDPWVRFAPAIIKVHAAYFTISNHGTKPRDLIGVESPAYARSDMHISRNVDGVATMEHIAQVTIAPHKSITFKPGGLHVMLMDAKAPLVDGATVPLVLIFADGEKMKVDAVVKKGMGMDMAPSGHHQHDAHPPHMGN
jgi:copper(I)-binding protein